MASKKTRVLVEICLLVLLTLLDARDLWFKVRWLSASDSFAFSTSEKTLLSLEKLTPTAPLTSTKEDLEARAAGRTSFLQKCESMEAFRGDNFLHTLNANCDIGGDTESPSQLVVSGNVKVDSMAWAACSLLYSYCRPPICREGVVADFLTRYQLPAPRVARAMMAEVTSPAEAELMGLLNLIGMSMPRSKVVCVEGFEYDHEKKDPFKAQIFGCASPNELRSAFVGLYALSFRDLHADKAWLTFDESVVLGMHFSVRQNAVSTFDIVAHGDQSLALVHTTSVNLSCSGFHFNLMIMLDFALMLLHATGSGGGANDCLVLEQCSEPPDVADLPALLEPANYHPDRRDVAHGVDADPPERGRLVVGELVAQLAARRVDHVAPVVARADRVPERLGRAGVAE